MNAVVAQRLSETQDFEIWTEPTKLPSGLLPVAQFDLKLLPQAFADWVGDIADRMQAPPEFVAVPAMVAAGSLIGRKVGIRPQANTDWTEVPNLWGCIIGRPGVMKSPAVQQALKPLNRLQAEARTEYDRRLKEYENGELEREIRHDAWKSEIKKRVKNDPMAKTDDLRFSEEEAPALRRYTVNDSSYQSLGELLIQNQNGLLVHRDELLSLLKALDREENVEARSFYLTGWNGSDGYTFDRIIRGTNLHVPAVTISMVGSTQPGRIKDYLSAAMRGGAFDDGMIQRFGMMVWPDLNPNWHDKDREPDPVARKEAFRVFDRLDSLSPDDIGAQRDPFCDDGAFLRFDPEGLDEFLAWRIRHEARLRSGELHPAMESHLAKYRKLIPSLALIHHLASGGSGAVGVLSVLSALAWGEFLESHAQRIYSAASDMSADAAKEILRHLRNGDLGPEFSEREIYRKGWSGLASASAVSDALDVLIEHGWIKAREIPSGSSGGRPTTQYLANPKGLRR